MIPFRKKNVLTFDSNPGVKGVCEGKIFPTAHFEQFMCSGELTRALITLGSCNSNKHVFA